MGYGYSLSRSLESVSQDPFFKERNYRRRGMDKMLSLNSELVSIREWDNSYRKDAIVHEDDYSALFSLDLHGFTRSSAEEAIEKFLSECKNLKTGTANVIHGRGEVLSEVVPEFLRSRGVGFSQSVGYVTVYGIPGGRYDFGIVTEADRQEKERAEEMERRKREQEAEASRRRWEEEERRRKEAYAKLREEEERRWAEQRQQRERARIPQYQDQGCLVTLVTLSSSILATVALLLFLFTSVL